MICPKCGAPAGKNDQFCSGCGYPLTQGENGPEKKKKIPVFLLVLIVVLEIAVIAGVVGFLFLRTRDEDNKSQTETTETEETEESSEEPDKGDGEAAESEEPEESGESSAAAEESSQPAEENASPTAVPSPPEVTEEAAAAEEPQAAAPPVTLVTEADTISGIRGGYQMVNAGDVDHSTASTTIQQEGVQNPPVNMLDDDPLTNWQEGAEGSGIGEYTEFALKKEVSVSALTFRLGNWKVEEYFYGNNRPKTLKIEMGGYSWSVTFPDEWKEFAVQFPEAVVTDYMKLTIEDVYRGDEWDDTVITDACVWY